MLETLRALENGQVRSIPQENSQATFAPILTKEDGRIDFSHTAIEICNRLRGFQPWPGAHTLFRGRHLQLHRAQPAEHAPGLIPGQLLAESTRLFAGCSDRTTLELIQLQPEGKRRMSARDFINGYRPQTGEKLGQ
jgi:methionyl-tRNA formyltransferase